MNERDRVSYAAAFEAIWELRRAGIAMKSANLRRQFPQESDAQIELRLRRWLETPTDGGDDPMGRRAPYRIDKMSDERRRAADDQP